MAGDHFTRARGDMVALLRSRHVRDPRVLRAMGTIPRHEFVPEALRDQAYVDGPLAIGAGQTISQPYMVALMTELLELTPESRVLEIGAGSGYQTAVLAEIAAEVYAVERIPGLARDAAARLGRLGISNVAIRCADGSRGWNEYAPFDAILAAAAGPAIPEPLVDQLAIGGRLVAPIGTSISQRLVRLLRTEAGIREEDHGGVVFVPLIGEHGFEG